MANVFIHFEPVGAIGEDINIDPDLPSYIVRGEPILSVMYAVFSNRRAQNRFPVVFIGSEQEQVWRVENPHGYRVQKMPVLKKLDAAEKDNVGQGGDEL